MPVVVGWDGPMSTRSQAIVRLGLTSPVIRQMAAVREQPGISILASAVLRCLAPSRFISAEAVTNVEIQCRSSPGIAAILVTRAVETAIREAADLVV